MKSAAFFFYQLDSDKRHNIDKLSIGDGFEFRWTALFLHNRPHCNSSCRSALNPSVTQDVALEMSERNSNDEHPSRETSKQSSEA